MDTIDLEPMTQEQYEVWEPRVIAEYAQENVASGRWSEAGAMERAREEQHKLLPEGLATPDQRLWSIVRSSDREPVGMLWVHFLQKPAPHAFIYNIEIYPPFRRRGYAEQTMTRLEDEARARGLESIKLHVFGHNTAARPLYEKLGYVPTNINMTKRLT